jgi:serine/threonine protein kinase/Flp pilus assembly protein TadD
MIDRVLGRYRIAAPLGEGGMGRVFLADDPVLGRKVALKVLAPDVAADPGRRSRLVHEARAASSLNHPSIVTVYDLGEDEGVVYVAMEWVDGWTLRDWARTETRTPVEVLRMFRQATGALAVAHAAGLVHRDLKPENLMVRRDGLLKVLDFGLARSTTPERFAETVTMPGTLVGTAPYMSPEQILGRPVGPASDVFSLGTMLYEILCGAHPFGAGAAVDTMHRILHDSPSVPSKINPAVTPDIDFVVMKALAKEPDRRYAAAKDLDTDLETCECACARASAADVEQPPSGPAALAVLPFKNIGGNSELNYLGVGLADAVITRLSHSPDLIVRPTSSIAAYENLAVDHRRVAQDLEVTSVLDASFQKAGGRFRATARLVEAASGRALWAGKVDVQFEDIFQVQDQVALGIAEALTARMSERAGAQGEPRAPAHEAYDLYLRSREVSRLGTKDGFLRAIEMLERSVQSDPQYADAWHLLGSSYFSMLDGGYDPDPTWYTRSEKALARALEIEPGHAGAIFAMAQLDLVRGRKREAHRGFIEARRRMPNVWTIHHYLAYLYRLCDMIDAGLEAETRAMEIDPGIPWPYWGAVRLHTVRGDFERGSEWLERARARFGSHPRTVSLEVALLLVQGRYGEALELAERYPAGSLDSQLDAVTRATCLLRQGRREEAAPFLARGAKFAEVDMDWAAWHGANLGILGDRDAAFACLHRAVALGNDSLGFYEDRHFFAELHDDPRWSTFITGVRERVAQWRREFSATSPPA